MKLYLRKAVLLQTQLRKFLRCLCLNAYYQIDALNWLQQFIEIIFVKIIHLNGFTHEVKFLRE